MGTSNNRKYEVNERNSQGVEFKVVFESLEEVHEALVDLQTMKQAYELQGTIQALRNLCDTSDGRVFVPVDGNLPKARWVMLAAAASYPNGVPTEIPLKKLGIDNSALSAYCTSKNNPTSKHLYIKDEHVYTRADGISWVDNLLKDS